MSHVTDVRNEKTSVSISFPTALIFFTRSTWLWLQPSSSLWLSWLGFLEWIFKKMEGKFRIPHLSGNHVCQLYNGSFESEVWSGILLGSLLRCYALEFLLFRLFWFAHLEEILWYPEVISFYLLLSLFLHSYSSSSSGPVRISDDYSLPDEQTDGSLSYTMNGSISELRSTVMDGRSLQEEFRRQSEARNRRIIDARMSITQPRNA